MSKTDQEACPLQGPKAVIWGHHTNHACEVAAQHKLAASHPEGSKTPRNVGIHLPLWPQPQFLFF